MSVPERGHVTRWVKKQLDDQGLLTFLVKATGEAPGWDDDPTKPSSRFHQYAVVTPMDTPEPASSIYDQGAEWILPYSLSYYGINHDQVEGQADRVRRILSEVGKQIITMSDGRRWSLMSCRVTSLGGVNLDRTPTPNEFNVRDTVAVRISKEL